MKRIISFHSKIERAKYFASDHQNIYGWVTDKERPEGVLFSDYVSGKMSTGDRNKKIKRLKFIKDQERCLLSNARCLGEGVDVPSLDGVAFIDPKRSQIDIVQAVGRAIRKSEDKNKIKVKHSTPMMFTNQALTRYCIFAQNAFY